MKIQSQNLKAQFFWSTVFLQNNDVYSQLKLSKALNYVTLFFETTDSDERKGKKRESYVRKAVRTMADPDEHNLFWFVKHTAFNRYNKLSGNR